MTPRGRKYGDKPSHPIYVWNGLLEAKHRRRIEDALWEFLWILDRITQEMDGIGLVLGGKPITSQEMAESLGLNERTIRRHLDVLEKHGYIHRTRTPRGFAIQVRNSQKFRVKVIGQPCPITAPPDRTVLSDQTGQNCPVTRTDLSDLKEKAAEEASKEAAGRLAVWSFLGVDGSRWAPSVRELCSNLYRNKNGQTPVELIAACMDGIAAIGGSIPPKLAQRAAELRATKRHTSQGIPELEVESWAR